MKKFITLASIAVLYITSAFAQNWQAVGADDFKQITPSGVGISSSRIFTDTLGNAYITYGEHYGNYTYQSLTFKKETANGWVKLTEALDTNVNIYVTNVVDKSGNLYYAKDTMIAGFANVIVKKFDGMVWTNLGSPFPTTVNSSLALQMKLLHNQTPYIIYRGKTSSVYPSMIKWDGTNLVAVGGAIANTSPVVTLFDFDGNDAPNVLYYDALSATNLIKKFDGSNWVTIMTNSASGFDFRIYNDTMYVSGGSYGYWGGVGQTYTTTVLKKYNGSSWVNVINVTGGLLPSSPSSKIVFDAAGNIYLAGGIIYKVTGSTATPIGANGDLCIKGTDTFYTAYKEDYFAGKVSFRKNINNQWIEDYPLGIAPYRGGIVMTYYTYIGKPRHYFFTDKNGTPYLFSRISKNRGDFAKYVGNSWDSIAAPFTSSMPDTTYSILTDTGNNIFMLLKDYAHLQKFNGTAWTNVGGTINAAYTFGSCVFDKNNIPYVAFVDNSSFGGSRVRVKKYDGTNWVDASTTMPFVSTGISENPLIACDTANNLSVLFKDGAGLYVSKFDGTNWNPVGSVIGSANSTDYSFALTEAGDPIVASLSVSAIKKPVVSKFNGTNWTVLGMPYFSYGNSKDLRLLVDKDTVYLAYTDVTLNKAVVTKFNGNYFGALGSQNISNEASSNPMLIKSGNDIYVSYASNGLFVKKLTNAAIFPIFDCPLPTATVTSVSDTTAFLIWPPNATVGYLYGISNTNTLPANIIYNTANNYTATGLQPNTTYYFFLRNVCGIDSSGWDIVSFTTSNITDIVNLHSAESAIKAYPNPFTNTISLSGLKPNDKLLLCDISGRVIQTWSATNKETQTFNTANIASGYYILKIITAKGATGLPMIKNRQ